MTVKEAYTTRELSDTLGVAQQNIHSRAKDQLWTSRPRAGRGGGKEWLLASMPESTRLAIRTAEERRALELAQTATQAEALATPASPLALVSPTRAPKDQAILDDKRRYRALAKADIIRLYLEWQRKHGTTRHQKAAFITAYMGGAWPQLKAELGGKISWKSIERWKLEQARAGSVLALADRRGLAHRGRSLLTEAHRMIILGHILNPNAPKVSQCAREIQKRCTAKGLAEPSEATIRRFVSAYAAECFDEFTLWREGKKAWNDKCSISILRDWSLVNVGDVVIADGHTLNFETINPETGKPCRMTLLLFFDGASSHPLGWEIMPGENAACISSAFRRTCMVLGFFPKIIYIDNGRAFRAKFFKGTNNFEEAGFCGLYKSLGCEVIHAWAYHGQSKPIERFFGSMHDMEVWMPSYVGNCIDHKPARMKRGETLHRKLYTATGGRPLTLEETHRAVAAWFVEYVHRPQHSGHLQGRTPAEVFQQAVRGTLPAADLARLDVLMMQKEIRTITKDGFSLHGRLYWHEALRGRRHPVLVRYDDVFEPQNVKVYTLQGEYICTALDRAHYGIAHGVHPAAQYLGSAAQQAAFTAAIELKKGQEKQSTATLKAMTETVILPEARARMAALTSTPPASAPVKGRAREVAPALTAAQRREIDAAREAGRAALTAAPSYTPSALKRFRDEPEKYGYLFGIRHEQGIPLVADDAAWMEYFENTPEYQRNFRKRYDDLRGLYAHRAARAKTA